VQAVAERLTAGQLASLAPGDTVTIESHRDGFGRTRRTAGTVARVDGAHIVVRTRGPRGEGTFVERYGRRDGLRVGGVSTAQLVNGDAAEPTGEQRKAHNIDRLYLAWRRNRGDVDVLRELHAAIADQLAASAGSR
jgi:hypothetical protein